MTGSLQVKKDLYFIVLNTRDVSGKRKQKWLATGLLVKGNKKRAERLLREKLQEYEAREKLVQTDITFSDAIREWLIASEMRVDEITLQGYEALSRVHLLPYFDTLKIKLADVDRHVIQTYINEKHRCGRVDGKGGLSAKTMRLHKNVMYQTLKEAVINNILPSNPCEYVVLPQLQHYESKFYTAEQITALLEAIKDEPIYPLIKVAVIYGLRRSEVCGLKWDSIDFDADTLMIKHTVTKVSKTVEKDKTKNAASRRSFPLLPEVKQLLLDLKAREAENRKLFGKEYKQTDYIFRWDDGRSMAPDFVSQKFAKLLRQHGFPHIRFHELRHSCASVLIAMGFSLRDVQEWLGHSDIKMTANIYSHLDVTRKKSIADKLGSSFSA